MTDDTLSADAVSALRRPRNTRKRGAWIFVRDIIIIFLVAFIFVRFLGANVVEQSGATGKKGKK